MDSLDHVETYFWQGEMVVEEENGDVEFNPSKVCLNKLFDQLDLVDGLVLEYIEWKVQLSEGNSFDWIEIICVVE